MERLLPQDDEDGERRSASEAAAAVVGKVAVLSPVNASVVCIFWSFITWSNWI